MKNKKLFLILTLSLTLCLPLAGCGSGANAGNAKSEAVGDNADTPAADPEPDMEAETPEADKNDADGTDADKNDADKADANETDTDETDADSPDTKAPDTDSNSDDDAGGKTDDKNADTGTSDETLTLGSTFVYDNLEFTLGDKLEWHVLENRYSDKNGRDVFSIDVTMTNLGDSSNGLNMYSINTYGPSGTSLSGVEMYFDDIRMAGQIRPGASLDSKIYVLYADDGNGDGDYYLEFKSFYETLEIIIPAELP